MCLKLAEFALMGKMFCGLEHKCKYAAFQLCQCVDLYPSELPLNLYLDVCFPHIRVCRGQARLFRARHLRVTDIPDLEEREGLTVVCIC